MINTRLSALGIFAVTLTLYAVTLPQTITLEDAGLFQMTCYLGGMSHPPGYPLFTGVCQAIVPLADNGVLAGNFLSALFAALACAALYFCVHEITQDESTALLAGLAYGLSATFWSQAIIIEVYTLAALLFLLCLYATLRYQKSGDLHWLCLSAFSFGLGLSNHWPLTLLSALALFIWLLPRTQDVIAIIKSIRLMAVIGSLLAGLTPYLLLLRPNPTISLFGEIDSLDKLVGYITRSNYIDQHEVAGLSDQFQYIGWLAGESVNQLGWFAAPFVITGLVLSFRRLGTNNAVALICLFLGSTLILNVLLGFSYEFLWQAVFHPYPIIAYAVLAAWFAVGVVYFADHVPKNLWLTFSTILLGAIGTMNFIENDRSKPGWVDPYGRTLLATLPADAIYFAEDDLEVGVIGYLHHIENVRPDIELRNKANLVFDNRLASPFEPLELQEKRLATQLAASDRPVFASGLILGPQEHHGAFYRHTPGEANTAIERPEHGPILDMMLDQYLRGLIKDKHEQHYATLRLLDFSRQYVQLALAGTLSTDGMTRLSRLQTTLPGTLATMETLLPLRNDRAKPTLQSMAESALNNMPAAASRHQRALINEYLGRIALIAPADETKAIAYFRESVAIYPIIGNTSLCPLRYVLRKHQMSAELNDLEKQYPQISCEG